VSSHLKWSENPRAKHSEISFQRQKRVLAQRCHWEKRLRMAKANHIKRQKNRPNQEENPFKSKRKTKSKLYTKSEKKKARMFVRIARKPKPKSSKVKFLNTHCSNPKLLLASL